METPQRALHIKGSYADVHETNFFKGCSPIEEANVEGQDVHCRQWSFLAHVWEKVLCLFPQETKSKRQTKNYFEIQYAHVVEDSLSVLSLGRSIHPTLTKGKKLSRAVPTTSFLWLRSLRRWLLHLSGTTLARGNPVADLEEEETMLNVLELFSESLIDNDGQESITSRRRCCERPH